MCGIAGAIGYDRKIIKRMNDAQRHRGPDGEGIYYDGICGLGHRRLAVIDLSSNAKQPMSNEDHSLVITFNGEIYNYRELRKDLQSHHKFRSKSDTEVILHLYEDLGEKCLEKLRGIFAFAIWDKKTKTLFAARDRLGVKPLIYTKTENGLIFASELRAILKTNQIDKIIHKDALRQYLLFGSVQSPETLISNVYKLPPGHLFLFKKNKLVIKKYWSLNAGTLNISKEEIQEQIKNLLSEAMKLETVSDIPIGIFLSGGIDSSILAALAKPLTKNLCAITIGFKEKGYNESKRAIQISKHLHLRHKNFLISSKKIMSKLPEIFQKADQPSADGFNTYIVSNVAQKMGLKVAISGLGGDELFIGYPSLRSLYYYLIVNRIVSLIPHFIRVFIFRLVYRQGMAMHWKKILYLLFKCKTEKEIYQLSRAVFLPDDVRNLMIDSQWPVRKLEQKKIHDKINQFSLYEIENYLNNTLLHDTDRMGMANSVEIRVPLLDQKLVEKMLTIPGRMKIGSSPKNLLTGPFERMMPHKFFSQKKRGFVIPFDLWFRHDLKPYCEKYLSHSRKSKNPYLNTKAVYDIWQSYLKSPGSYSYAAILCLLSLTNWHEKNIG